MTQYLSFLAQPDKRVFEFDEFLENNRKVKSLRDKVDECAWRSIFDAIRYAQGIA